MNIWNQIDKENIYQTIYDIEGEKQPHLSLDALNECADYLIEKMKSYGMRVRVQNFKVDGSDIEFRNIEGSIGNVEELPAAVLTAHYDTVVTSPGANDDAVGVATMLEIGRVLALQKNPPPVYFVAVTLEENNNPRFFVPEYESLISRGIKDKDYHFTSWKYKKGYELVKNFAESQFQQGISYDEGYTKALEEFKHQLDKEIIGHFEDIIPLVKGLNPSTTLGFMNRIGSYTWLKDALENNKKIAFNITLDEMGFFKHEEGTQRNLAGINVYDVMTSRYKIDEEKRIGNFLAISSNVISGELANKISEKLEVEDIDMPYGRVHLPMTYEEIVSTMPMALNSDHAGFWKHNIPAVFLFDTATARNPYGHSYGDNIDILDFNMIERVAKGVVAALIDEEVLNG